MQEQIGSESVDSVVWLITKVKNSSAKVHFMIMGVLDNIEQIEGSNYHHDKNNKEK